jgi:iron(III) transport system substrate-binding protein
MTRLMTLGLVAIVLVAACAPATPAAPTPAPAKPTSPPAAAAPPAAKPTAAPAAKPAAPTSSPAPAAKAPAAPAKPAEKAADKPAASDAYQKVLEAARQEARNGALAVWVATPRLSKTHTELFETFKQRFGLEQFSGEWLPIHQTEANSRVQLEAQAGKVNGDLISASLTEFKPVFDKGLIEKYDWVGTFGQVLPGVKDASERVGPEFQGAVLLHYDIAYGLAFNTEMIQREQVPSSYAALTEPQWRGKLLMNNAGGAPFDVLSLRLGHDQTLDLVRRVVANQPLLKQGSPAVVNAVVSGEAPLGIGSISQVGTQKMQGAPVEWRPLDQVAVLPLYFYVPAGAPHPNLARLFLAWTVSEGMAIQERNEALGRVTDPSSTVAQVIKRDAPNAQLVEPKTVADVEKQDVFRKAMSEVIAAPR